MDRGRPGVQNAPVESKPQNVKRELLLSVLTRSWASLHIDGRVEGVELPDWLRNPSVTLQIGYDMPVPIPDLVIDDEGVRATLSFQRTPHACRIPWRAIFAISDFDGRGALFADDMPAELAAAASQNAAERTGEIKNPAPVPAPAQEPGEAGEATPPEPPRFKSGRPRPSHLKLVN